MWQASHDLCGKLHTKCAERGQLDVAASQSGSQSSRHATISIIELLDEVPLNR